MNIMLTFRANQDGEIKRFMDLYYKKPSDVLSMTRQMTYCFDDKMNAQDMITTFLDNNIDYDMELWVDTGRDTYLVSNDNVYEVLCNVLL